MNRARLKSFLPWLLPVVIQFAFLFHALTSGHTTTRDSFEYLEQAKNILHHFTFYCGDLQEPVKDVSLYSRRPPGYGIFILLTSLLLHWPALTLLLQSALSVFNIYLGYRILKSLIPDFRSIWLYLLPASLIPSQFALATTFMSEIPFQTTILLSIWYLRKHEKPDGTFRHLYLHHLCLFLAYLIKPVAVFLWIPSVFYLLLTGKETRSTTRLTILSFLHLIVIVSMMMRNYQLTGIAEYSSIRNKLLINYNMPALLNTVYDEATASKIMDSLQTEMTGQDYTIQTALADQFIRKHLEYHYPEYIHVHLKGMLKFFIDPGRWELEQLFNPETEQAHTTSWSPTLRAQGWSGLRRLTAGWPAGVLPYYLLSVIVTLVSFAGCIWWLFQKRSDRRARLLFAGLLLYFSVLTGPSGSARFRLPVSMIPVIATLMVVHGRNRLPDSSAPNPHS